eukprot:c55226_g1_i1.p1 GENE.c55226_g1_i1~~c55226_g1_i1.p1  ORF type:complete len:199 (+),score=30.68 c55226_g1_i1:24-620(+)
MKRWVLVQEGSEEEVETVPPPRKRTKSNPKPITADAILRKAGQLIETQKRATPEYTRALQAMSLEVSSRMTSSAAKTVFDTATQTPRCIRLSLPIFSAAENFESDEFRGVLMHEAAHWIAGLSAGHTARWKRVCEKLGGIIECHHTLSSDHHHHDQPRQSERQHQESSSPRQPRLRRGQMGNALPSQARDIIDALIQF